jgi:hypothetical protein
LPSQKIKVQNGTWRVFIDRCICAVVRGSSRMARPLQAFGFGILEKGSGALGHNSRIGTKEQNYKDQAADQHL